MMFAAAAVVRDDQGRTFYEHPDAFTTTQLVFFPRLTDSELALYQAMRSTKMKLRCCPEDGLRFLRCCFRSAMNQTT